DRPPEKHADPIERVVAFRSWGTSTCFGGASRCESASRLPSASTRRKRTSLEVLATILSNVCIRPSALTPLPAGAGEGNVVRRARKRSDAPAPPATASRQTRAASHTFRETTHPRRGETREADETPAGVSRFARSIGAAVSRFAVAVTEAIHGLDAIELRIRLLKLPSQPLDVTVDRTLAHIRVVRVALLVNLIPRLHMTGMADERVQHHELGDGQRDRHRLPLHRVTLHVHLEVSEPHRRLGFALRPPLVECGAAEEH